MNNKGVALISVMGLIAVLALIGISFALSMRFELRAASNAVNRQKAKNFSDMGTANVVAQLKYGTSGAVNNAFDSSTEFTWDATENAWLFTLENDGLDNDNDISTDEAGELDQGGRYNVLVRDLSSMINVNDANPNLATILNNLAAIIGGGTIDANTGDIIVGNRPLGGYRTKEEVKFFKTLGTADNQTINSAEYDLIENFITVYSYQNTATVSPSTLAAETRNAININTAPSEVLQSVLRGLAGGSNSMTNTEASNIATSIIANRPFRSWDEVWTFLEAREGDATITNGDAALIMANANPNTDLMDFNYNQSWLNKHRYYDVSTPTGAHMTSTSIIIDKADLTTSTTEFCFHSGGFYEITSTGELYNNLNSATTANLLSSVTIQNIVQIFDFWHETTQNDFDGGTHSNTEDYPEPSFNAAADYDGAVMIDTVTYADPSGTNYMRASFTSGEDADSGGGVLTALDEISGTNKKPNSGTVDPTVSNPGDILNDGVLIDDSLTGRDVRLSYTQSGNIYNRSGTIEFWVKPIWDGSQAFSTSGSGRVFFSSSNVGGSVGESAGGGFLAFYKMDTYSPYGGPRFDLQASNYLLQVSAGSQARSFKRWYGNFNDFIYPHWEDRQWHHIAITWFEDEGSISVSTVNAKSRTIDSTVAPRKGFNFLFYIDGQQFVNSYVASIDAPLNHKNYTEVWANDDTGSENGGAGTLAWYNDKRTSGSVFSNAVYDHDNNAVTPDEAPIGNRYTPIVDDPTPLNPSAIPPSIRVWGEVPGSWDSHRFYLGWDSYNGPKHIDATMDEIRIYDTARSSTDIAADYNVGRYYAGNDANFTSQTFALPANVDTLGTIAWTEHLPGGISADVELDVHDGTSWQGLTLSAPEGNSLNLSASGNIQYRATFRASATPLLDTPLLNDLTITYLIPTDFLYRREIRQ